MDAAKFPRSTPILERFKASDAEPSNGDKAKFWYEYARDVMASHKNTATQIAFGIAYGHWALAKAIKADRRADDLERRLAALERRLESERKGFYYRGTYAEGESYEEGDFVTDHGSMWACLTATKARPGTSDDWQLAVKAGRDRRR